MNAVLLQNSCRSSPSKGKGFKLCLIALLSRGLQLKSTQLHGGGGVVVVVVVGRGWDWGVVVVGGGVRAHDNVTRLEMKHPHLQTPL